MATGFECAIQRRAANTSSRILKGKNLGVRTTRDRVRATPDDHTFRVHDQRTDHRIGGRRGAASFGEAERLPHVEAVAIRYHFSSNSASTYSSGENGIRSSIASPTPT